MMNSRLLGKIFLIYTIASKFTRSEAIRAEPAATTNTNASKLFTFDTYNGKEKDIYFKDEEAKKFFETKPTGLQKTVLDLDFPEGPETTANTPRYRIVQCLAVGDLEYLQRKIYRKISLKLTSKEPYTDSTSSGADQSCSNTVVVTLSPPGTINSTDNVLTNVYKVFEKKVNVNKNASQTVVFDDVLDSGFLEMDLFWVNFEITGKCSQYLEVELLKPQNTDLKRDDADGSSEQQPSVQNGSNGGAGVPGVGVPGVGVPGAVSPA